MPRSASRVASVVRFRGRHGGHRAERKRFLGDGNDSMEVTSLVRSLVHLPLGASGAKVHPSPGGFNSSRLALQSDPSGERCVAFVASGGGAWRHEVPFAGGVNVAEGKEAMLKPITVSDGVTARLDAVSHRHEIQSLALHDPASADPSRTTGSDDRVRLASVDASGRCLVTTIARDAAFSSATYDLRPLELAGAGGDVHGWAGASFDPDSPDAAAVARMHAKSIDVFDGAPRRRPRRRCTRRCTLARSPTSPVRIPSPTASLFPRACRSSPWRRGTSCRCGTRVRRSGAGARAARDAVQSRSTPSTRSRPASPRVSSAAAR